MKSYVFKHFLPLHLHMQSLFKKVNSDIKRQSQQAFILSEKVCSTWFLSMGFALTPIRACRLLLHQQDRALKPLHQALTLVLEVVVA